MASPSSQKANKQRKNLNCNRLSSAIMNEIQLFQNKRQSVTHFEIPTTLPGINLFNLSLTAKNAA